MTRREQRRRSMVLYRESGLLYKIWDGIHSALVYSLFVLACLAGVGLYCAAVQLAVFFIY